MVVGIYQVKKKGKMSIIIWKVLTSSVVVKNDKKCHIYVYAFGQAKAVVLLVSKLQCSVSIRAVVRPHQDSELPVHVRSSKQHVETRFWLL